MSFLDETSRHAGGVNEGTTALLRRYISDPHELDVFLCGPWHFEKLSTFARVVVEERSLRGAPPNSTFFMQPRDTLAMHVEHASPLTSRLVPTGALGAGAETIEAPALNCVDCVD